VKRLALRIDPKKVAAMVTPAGGEVLDLAPGRRDATFVRDYRGLLRDFLPGTQDVRKLESLGFDLNKMRRFLKDGIGDQVGLHMHDAPRLLDSDLSGIVGGSGAEAGFGALGLLVKFVFGPSSVSIPVKDAKVVDEYLKELDRILLAKRRDVNSLGVVFGKEVDFYTFPLPQGHTVRCVALNLFGLKWRLYWARIGDGLYVVTRPFISGRPSLAAHADGKRPARTEPAHAVLRLRPENWNAVLPGLQPRGGPRATGPRVTRTWPWVSNVSRGVERPRRRRSDAELLKRVSRIYGTRPFCRTPGRIRSQQTVDRAGGAVVPPAAHIRHHGQVRVTRGPVALGPPEVVTRQHGVSSSQAANLSTAWAGSVLAGRLPSACAASEGLPE